MDDDKDLKEWVALLKSDDSKEERRLQEFLERHPRFLPGAHSLDSNSGHPPWPRAVISQPPLPDLSTKKPDFMWIASDSAYLYPILIEIETPWKRWWYQSKIAIHSDLTTALGQVMHWKRWFNDGANHPKFYRHYRIERDQQDLTLAPRFVIIHGRRDEANRSNATAVSRGGIPLDPDTRLMTFDRLHPDPRSASFGTVAVNEHGFSTHPLSPYALQTITDQVEPADEGVQKAGYRFKPPKRRTR